MRGRCFDVMKNRWKTREQLPFVGYENLTIWFGGFESDPVALRASGWFLTIETNHFTKKQRLIIHNPKLGLAGRGEMSELNVFIESMTNQRHFFARGESVKLRNEIFDFDELSTVQLLDAVSKRLDEETPVKPPKPKRKTAEIISIVKRVANF